jgi:hypothetical protein
MQDHGLGDDSLGFRPGGNPGEGMAERLALELEQG